MYSTCCHVGAKRMAGCRAAGDERVVAMLVVDTDTKLAGIDVDRRGVLFALQNGLGPNRLLIHDDITGNRVTRAHVLDRLRTMPVGADDTVFFYYSGNGAVLENVDHALTTTGGDILRLKFRIAIRAKNPRLAIIVTDCFANVVRRPPRPSAPAGQAPAVPREQVPPIRSLLLGPTESNAAGAGAGQRDDGVSTRGHDSGNLGITYQVVQLGDRLGAKVIRPPVAGSPAAAIGLEPGDLIYEIDGLPIRHFVDVLNHNGKTSLSFVNVRTNRAEMRWVDLPAFNNYPPGVPTEQFASNLGLYYQLVAFGSAMGVRLSRYPTANSAFAVLRLEPGDMLIDLDDQPIRNIDDVANHRFGTTFHFVNIRTGLIQAGEVNLP